MCDKKIQIIAIDGPAAAGKSTIAAKLAERLGAVYINTGNMYRAITLEALRKKINLDNPSEKEIKDFLDGIRFEYISSKNTDKIILNGEDVTSRIRSPDVASAVSKLSAIAIVREWLVKKQREIALKTNLAVMEGRDIGTVVFPDARWKFFLTASPEVRARRRLEQSGETFEGSTIASVAKEIAERDRIDSTRSVAPLRKADDAIEIDTSNLSIDDVLEKIISIIKKN